MAEDTQGLRIVPYVANFPHIRIVPKKSKVTILALPIFGNDRRVR